MVSPVTFLINLKTVIETDPMEIPQCLEASSEAFPKSESPIMAIDGAMVSGVT